MDKKSKKSFQPSNIIAITFFVIIAAGTLLFMLPFMTRDGEGLTFMQALFTSTSAVCVTGLTLIDPAVTLSQYGQILLLILIEIGGISLVTFATFFLFTFRKKNGLKSLRLAQEYTNIDRFSQIRPLVKTIVFTALTCQLIGAALLCIRFVPLLGTKGIWVSVFTACSAYCNAGFDIFGTASTEFSSLIPYQNDVLVILVISAMIILGGLGFFVFYDILHYRKNRHLNLHTKVMLLFTFILLLLGTCGILLYEYAGECMQDLSWQSKILNSFFQSVSARTAGFASVDIASFRDVTKILMISLMFIGAGSGSTGGGVKVTTFAVLVMSVVSVIAGRNNTIMFRHRIDNSIITKSMAIFFMGIVWIFIIAAVLVSDNPDANFIDALFEATSAFATVGISVGITGAAKSAGLVSLIITMFIGRLGPICFVTALNIREKRQSHHEVIPEGRIMVG